jgi:hypothetical protein
MQGRPRGRALFAYKMLQWHANIKPRTVKFRPYSLLAAGVFSPVALVQKASTWRHKPDGLWKAIHRGDSKLCPRTPGLEASCKRIPNPNNVRSENVRIKSTDVGRILPLWLRKGSYETTVISQEIKKMLIVLLASVLCFAIKAVVLTVHPRPVCLLLITGV